MEDTIKLLESRLQSKREERERQILSIVDQTKMNSESLCMYERNAIDNLAVILQLSAEIRELEFVLSMLRACCPNKHTA